MLFAINATISVSIVSTVILNFLWIIFAIFPPTTFPLRHAALFTENDSNKLKKKHCNFLVENFKVIKVIGQLLPFLRVGIVNQICLIRMNLLLPYTAFMCIYKCSAGS